MTKDELVGFLNERAAKSGSQPVTKRILSDWIDKGLLEPAHAYGREIGLNPEWHLAEETVEYAQLLQALRSLGVKRASSLRIYLWMFCQDANPEHVLEALSIEYRRAMQRFRRAHGWFLGAHTYTVRSGKRDRLLEKLSGQLDPALSAAGFKIPSELLLELSRESIEPTRKPINEVLASAVDQLGVVPFEFRDELKRQLLNGTLSLPLGLKGSLGDPDETAGSVEEALERIGLQDLVDARNCVSIEILGLLVSYIRVGLFAPQQSLEISAAYLKAFVSMLRPEWLALRLSSAAAGFYRLRA